MDIKKQVEFLKSLSKEDLKKYKKETKFLLNIQIKNDKYEINNLMLDNNKRIWIIIDEEKMNEFKLLFLEGIKSNIIRIYKELFDSNINTSIFHFLLVDDLSVVKKLNKNITHLPLVFETCRKDVFNTLYIDDIKPF